MNKSYTEFHLKEALEQLEQTLCSINSGEYDETDLQPDMEHLYHHINTSWNARHASSSQAEKCSQEDYEQWRLFPTDIDMRC